MREILGRKDHRMSEDVGATIIFHRKDHLPVEWKIDKDHFVSTKKLWDLFEMDRI